MVVDFIHYCINLLSTIVLTQYVLECISLILLLACRKNHHAKNIDCVFKKCFDVLKMLHWPCKIDLGPRFWNERLDISHSSLTHHFKEAKHLFKCWISGLFLSLGWLVPISIPPEAWNFQVNHVRHIYIGFMLLGVWKFICKMYSSFRYISEFYSGKFTGLIDF